MSYICRKFDGNDIDYILDLPQKIAKEKGIAICLSIALETPFFSTNMLISHNAALFEKTTKDLTAYQMAYLEAMNDGVSSGFTKSVILKKYNLGTSANIKVIQKALVEKEIIEVTRNCSTFLDPLLPIWLKKQSSSPVIEA